MTDPLFPDAPRLPRLLFTTAALTVAAEFLLYGVEPGLGWALFFLLLWAGIGVNRDGLEGVTGKDLVLGGMLMASAAQMVWRPSFSNGLVLVLLTVYLSGHLLHREIFWDTRAFVACYNVRGAAATGRKVDLPYLHELGPSAWPSLRAIADAAPESPLAGQKSDAASLLEAIRDDEKAREAVRDWRSFRGHRANRRGALEFPRVSP